MPLGSSFRKGALYCYYCFVGTKCRKKIKSVSMQVSKSNKYSAKLLSAKDIRTKVIYMFAS